jgi:putative DNA methylase
MVCRKAADDRRPKVSIEAALQATGTTAETKVRRFNSAGRRLSLNDVRIVVLS